MSRPPPHTNPRTPPRVVTGNALIEGHVVWLAADGSLIRDMTRAQVLTDPDAAEAALARTAVRRAEVVGCYLAEVRLTPQGPQPTHFREGFRRDGPSPAAKVPARLAAV
jgi:hypothetical protein